MEDYIDIVRRIFNGTRYDASDEDIKLSIAGVTSKHDTPKTPREPDEDDCGND